MQNNIFNDERRIAIKNQFIVPFIVNYDQGDIIIYDDYKLY